jgi:small-conductance mechanosensitive channel
MLALGFAPTLMWITLALTIYLTVVELRELRPHYLWWFWWILLVVMTHFVGYIILRGYALRRRRLART